MAQLLLIPERLPSLNELIAANRQNKYLGAKKKRETEDIIKKYIVLNEIKPVERPCIVHMVFHEPTKRRDSDNVESAKKYILDALVKSGILKNDNPTHVVASPSFTVYDEPSTQVVVTIIEGDPDKLRLLMKAASDTITGEQPMPKYKYHCPMPDELRNDEELYKMLCETAAEYIRYDTVGTVFPKACANCTAQCGYGRKLVQRYPDLPERVEIRKARHA